MLKKIIPGLLCASLMISYMPVQQIQAANDDAIVLKIHGSGTVNVYKDETLTGNPVTYFAKNGNYGGDAALLEETDNAYKIMIAGTVGWVAKSSGLTPLEESDLKGVSYYSVNSSGELYHRISSDPTGTSYISSVVMGPAPEELKKGKVYYSYDGHYFYEDLQEMIDDYRKEDYDDAVNEDPYYNYYQYLPLHAKSNYDGDDFNDYIENTLNMKDTPDEYPAGSHESMLYGEGDTFYEVQEEYGINALIMFAISMNETGSGTSKLAIENNNMFGLGAVDSNPDAAREYDDVYESVEAFASYHMNWGYLDFADGRYFGGSVGNKASGINVKYCSDPYWGEKAAMYAYRVDKALGLEDYEAYTIAIHEDTDEYDLLKEAKSSSDVIASPKTVPFMPYLITGEEGKYYQVLTDFHLDEDREVLDHDEDLWYLPYDYENNYAYIKKSELTIIFNGNQTIGGKDTPIELDPALLAEINTALGRAEDTPLTSSQARKVTELTIDASQLEDLDGIEVFTKLKKLTITDLHTETDIAAMDQLTSLKEIDLTPKSAAQLKVLGKCKALEDVIIRDYTLTKASDLPELSLDSFVMDGGANNDLSLLQNVDADELKVINQVIEGEAEVAGEVMIYTNKLYDALGDLIDLSKAKVTVDGQKAIFTYDKASNQLSFQATSGQEISIAIDMTLRGQVKSYTAVVTILAERADLSVNGWQQVGNHKYYVENNAVVTDWKQIDGKWYYFLDNGAMATGWTKDKANCWYMLDYTTGVMKTGWVADGSDWYYLNPANGIMQTGWQTIDGAQYYLLTSGATAGAMATGIMKIEDKFYEFEDNGALIGETTQPDDWVDEPQQSEQPNETPDTPENPKEDEEEDVPTTPENPETPDAPENPETPDSPVTPETPEEIVLDASQNGWNKYQDSWYYVENNAVVKDWKQIEGTWYYFLDHGLMATGWTKDKANCWYMLDYSTGAMKTGWVADGSDWYYLNPANGIMQTGWQTIDGAQYYLLTSGSRAGAMAKGIVEIDGLYYEFADNGAFIQ